MNGKKFAWGILLGGLAGAAYGLWTAPRSGEETVNMTKDYVDRIQADGEIVSRDIQKLNQTIQKLKDDALPKAQIFQEQVQISLNRFDLEATEHINEINRIQADMSETLADLDKSNR